MLLLGLDTATPAVSAVLAEIGETGTRVIGEAVTIDGRAHGELLAPQIDALLAGAGVKPRDLAAIAAGVGPGPYTGLRVGLMTAAMMSTALGVPAYAVCTLDVFGAATTGDVLVATDARRREVYWALYRDGTRLDGPNVSKPAPMGVLTGVGDGARIYADALGVTAVEPFYPPMARLVQLVADRVRAKAPSERLTPLYLRRPDAVAPSAPKRVLA